MSHQPPAPRTASASTPTAQNASIHVIKLGRELPAGVAGEGSAALIPGATIRGKSPAIVSLFVAADGARKRGGAEDRISHANVKTAATGIASSAASAATYRTWLARRARAIMPVR